MSEIVPIRASSMGTLFSCAYRWEAEQLLGMQKPASGRSHLGTALHAASASVDLATMNEAPYAPADVADLFHGAFTKPAYEVDWRNDDATPTDLEVVGLRLIDAYAREWSPRFDFVAVEKQIVGVEYETSSGVVIELTGRMDRARIVQPSAVGYPHGRHPLADIGGPETFPKRIADIKTGKRAVTQGRAETRGHKPQLGIYALIEEAESGVPCDDVSEIIGMKTSGKPEIATGIVRGAKDILLGEDGLIEQAGKMLKAGLFPPNPRDMLCDARYCVRHSTCKYRD